MKSIKNLIYLILFIAVLLIFKFFFFPSGQNEKAAPQGKGIKAPPALVSIYVVEPREMDNNLFITGTLMASEAVELKPEISGKVTGIYINEGQSVSKGKVLLKLNDEDLIAQLNKVVAEIKVSEDKVDRYKKLLGMQGVSIEEYETASNQLQSLKADAEVLKVQINRTNIKAPFDGVLGLRNISIGSYINPSQIVTTIQQLNPIKIDFSVPERYAGMIKLGSTINFTTESSSAKFSGKVYAFEPSIDASTRSLKIRAQASNSGNVLKPGAFAKIELVLAKNESAIMIPSQAIVPVLKGQQVFIKQNGKAVAVPIETGLRNETMVQVLSGLNKGDSVVVTGVLGLREGVDLKIQK